MIKTVPIANSGPRQHLGIDASNLRQGGGITHVIELLNHFDPNSSKIDQVTIWCSASLRSNLPVKEWLTIRADSWIDKNIFIRFMGMQFYLPKAMRDAGCNVCFFPGGIIPIGLKLPTISMSQNMLPFRLSQAALFGIFSPIFWKLFLLRWMQILSFRRATGMIFLSRYAQDAINKYKCPFYQVVIPHGIDKRFVKIPRRQRDIHTYTFDKPFRLIYVSILMPYKHQIEVARAIAQLYAELYPVACSFIGPSYVTYGNKLLKELKLLDPDGKFLSYEGEISYNDLEFNYHEADGFVFASSCENLPNILIEAMSSGLPIASSKMRPMLDILGDGGFYFDPQSPNSIAEAIRTMLLSDQKRSRNAKLSYEQAGNYSWIKCARDTFQFISMIGTQK